MQTISRTTFSTVKSEGALLPVDLLQRVFDAKERKDVAELGLRPEDYHLPPHERLNEVINHSWNRCFGAWTAFEERRAQLPADDTGTTLTRERWLLTLFQALDYGRLQTTRGVDLDDDRYPISHMWGATPIHLVTFRQDLDKRSTVQTALKRTPHSLVQEFLNRSDAHQWAFVSNGLRLRILRDNASFTRPAYVEFDLESMMTGERYADFALLWLICHQSRVEVHRTQPAPDADVDAIPDDSAATNETNECWLERWMQQADKQGARALDTLRDGVQEAIEALGRGFLARAGNDALKAQLRSGALSNQEYYRQLLRIVYRLIFLLVAEDRNLLLPPETPPSTRQRYERHYSLNRLRAIAEKMRGGPHGDLWRRVNLLFTLLRTGYAPLGIPGLDSFLFSARATPALDDLVLANHALLDAVRALAFTIENSVRRSVDYRNLDSEELGSVYESLLELHPTINIAAATFDLKTVSGSERKTTGSYYTPPSLVNALLDSALEPVVADRLATCADKGLSPREAILSIKILDPACGSGHFLIGAARRLARRLARIQTGDAEPAPDAIRKEMRAVVSSCIHGVDINEMAVELCKVALWMEALEPGKPLGFLDKNIQCGNSLLGVTPRLDISVIPDNAFKPVTGDDKTTASALRKRNRTERTGQLGLNLRDRYARTASKLDAWRTVQMTALAAGTEDGVPDIHGKEETWQKIQSDPQYGPKQTLLSRSAIRFNQGEDVL